MTSRHLKIPSPITTTKAIAFGWAVLSFFLSTTIVAEDVTETLPLPLASSVMFEQFDHGSLYKTHFEAPYNQHICQPRKIHLSPSSDIDIDTSLYNATVSFTLDLGDVAAMALERERERKHKRSGGDLVRTIVNYGRGDALEGSVAIYYDRGDYLEDPRNTIAEEYTLIRFNYTSPATGEYYKSDLIHHVLLKNLEAGRQRYWYTIKVQFLKLQSLKQDTPSHAVQPFFPPLMSPIHNWYTPRHLVTSPRFFLRGSYFKNQAIDGEESKSQRGEPEVAVVVLGETPSYEFTTPPLYGTPTSIALVGDLGQTKNSTRTMARILDAARSGNHEINTARGDGKTKRDDLEAVPVTSLFIAGDLSYADGDPNRWESWLDLAEPLLREVPFVSVPGNHEVECDKITHDVFVPYESFFRNPNRIQEAIEVPPSEDYINTFWHHQCSTPSEFLGRYDYGNAYFSHKQGLVHTIFLNSYTSLLDGSKQREWLVKTALPSVDRTLTPWLVVIFHTPLYTTFKSHYGELNPELMKASGLRRVFERHKVNLVVSGHDHAYLRTKTLDGDGNVSRDGKAPVFWTLGAGGNREGHSEYRNPDQAEEFVAKRDNDEYGFGLFFAPNRTHARLQWMRDDDNNYINGDDSSSASTSTSGNSSLVVRDSVWIENY